MSGDHGRPLDVIIVRAERNECPDLAEHFSGDSQLLFCCCPVHSVYSSDGFMKLQRFVEWIG